MTAYYNEIDPFAAAWLRELIKHGHIAPGDVDERSITDVRATDLLGYRQVHFFAGIGGWSLAARLAGIPDDFPLWTGSAPCQPFSDAGAKRGIADERHLWPIMRDLVAECRPTIVAGEQVASGLGLDWLASVRSDLETEGYAVGAADLCAASVGAPHIRQRLYWGGVRVADAGSSSSRRDAGTVPRTQTRVDCEGLVDGIDYFGHRDGRAAFGLAYAGRQRAQRWTKLGVQPSAEGPAQTQARQQQRGGADGGSGGDGVWVADATDNGRGYESGSNRMGDAPSTETGRRRARPAEAFTDRRINDGSGIHTGWTGTAHPGWRDLDWLYCRDGKWRPVRSGSFPLAHGIPNRVGRLRGYGNAIVPQVAAAFLRALLSAGVTP